MNKQERNQLIVNKFIEYASERKAIAFCCDVQHCDDLANGFRSHGIASIPVWGDMPAYERKEALEAFKMNRIQVLTSCGILTEGFDEPSVNAIVMARPTKSQSLYIQCVGRGLRKFPGKENCLCLDFTDKYHNLESIMSLSNTIAEATQVVDRQLVKPTEEVDRRPKIEILEEVDKEFDIVGVTRFLWIDIGNNEWSLQDDDRKEIVIKPQEEGFVASLYLPDGSVQNIVDKPLPLEYCEGCAEDYARRNLKIAFANANALWMMNPLQPTKGQLDYLRKEGAYKSGMTRGECALAIRRLVALKNKQRRNLNDKPLTDKQKYFLLARGVEVNRMTKFQAMQVIGDLRKQEKALSA